MTKALTALIAVMMVASCGAPNGLRKIESAGNGPDPFSVIPSAPLQMPSDLATLPAPTPGARNLVDPTPKADAIAALGGRPDAVFAGGIPAGDRALVAAASRRGVPAGIRATVAAEDKAYRSGVARFAGAFGGDAYFAAYSRQRLDAYTELARLRALGVETPTAPPR